MCQPRVDTKGLNGQKPFGVGPSRTPGVPAEREGPERHLSPRTSPHGDCSIIDRAGVCSRRCPAGDAGLFQRYAPPRGRTASTWIVSAARSRKKITRSSPTRNRNVGSRNPCRRLTSQRGSPSASRSSASTTLSLSGWSSRSTSRLAERAKTTRQDSDTRPLDLGEGDCLAALALSSLIVDRVGVVRGHHLVIKRGRRE